MPAATLTFYHSIFPEPATRGVIKQFKGIRSLKSTYVVQRNKVFIDHICSSKE